VDPPLAQLGPIIQKLINGHHCKVPDWEEAAVVVAAVVVAAVVVAAVVVVVAAAAVVAPGQVFCTQAVSPSLHGHDPSILSIVLHMRVVPEQYQAAWVYATVAKTTNAIKAKRAIFTDLLRIFSDDQNC